MIQVDLITGFLGSGKTTFIKKYVQYLNKQGYKIGIIENDYGAVNVDMMLLQDMVSDQCEIQMVTADDPDCHRRRFKTKLINMAMLGYDRVIVEPSGIYDVDEFFDILHEEPLDKWYVAGNVIAIVDSGLEETLSRHSSYLLCSQIADAGKVILSKSQLYNEDTIENTIQHLNRVLETFKCKRRYGNDVLIKDWNAFDENDYKDIVNSGYAFHGHIKLMVMMKNNFKNLFYMNLHYSYDQLKQTLEYIFKDEELGDVFRIKGFMEIDHQWYSVNATKCRIDIDKIDRGQDVIIVIGENINEEKMKGYWKHGKTV